MSEQLQKYLTDVHSIEVQALAQMERAPRIAGDSELADVFSRHLDETREQERLVRSELERRGADPSKLKDIAGKVGGLAMVAFAKLNPDTPGKLVAHGFSYEHMEIAAYELLARIARGANDGDIVRLAQTIEPQERAMAERLEASFDRVVDLSLREKGADDPGEEVVKYLRDAHALESQAVQLLQGGEKLAGVDQLTTAFRQHLEETREHKRMVEERLKDLDSGPSRFQSAALRMGGLNLGGFFGAQPDTPVKLAGFAYAFEHLEIAGYELLRRVAGRAGDRETVAVADAILIQERAAADTVARTWDAVAQGAVAQLA